MDIAVPLTVVTYSEPHRETAVELPPASSTVRADAPELAHSSSHTTQPPSERPHFSDSDSDNGGEHDGRGESGDAQVALELQKEEMRRSGLLPDDMNAGTVPELEQNEKELHRRLSSRLSDMTPTYTKHKPRVNSVDVRPEDFMTDRELLAQRLQTYGLMERVVKGDGNCQFRAVADQLYRTPHAHYGLRKAVVARIKKHPKLYSEYVPEDFSTYCRSMEKDGTWGDHVTLQAVADLFRLKIYVLTSFPGSDFIEIAPSEGEARADRSLYVSFWAEVHYNSIYPASDPPRDVGADKMLGSRRLHRLFHGRPTV